MKALLPPRFGNQYLHTDVSCSTCCHHCYAHKTHSPHERDNCAGQENNSLKPRLRLNPQQKFNHATLFLRLPPAIKANRDWRRILQGYVLSDAK